MLSVFDQQVNEQLENITQAYARKDKLDRLLNDARGLRAQATQAGSTSDDGLALILLKAEAFASSSGLPGELHVPVSAGDQESQLADVDALVDALEQDRSQMDEEIRTRSELILTGKGYEFPVELSTEGFSIPTPLTASLGLSAPGPLSPTAVPADGLVSYTDQEHSNLFDPETLMQLAETSSLEMGAVSERIRELYRTAREMRAEVEAINGQLKELTRARDQAWETHSTLQVKMDEVAIETGMMDVEVRLASPALVPVEPIDIPRKLQTVVAATATGFMLSLVLAFVFDYLGLEYDLWATVGALVKRREDAA